MYYKSAAKLEGEVFGRWTVGERVGSRSGKSLWHCTCECGTERDVISTTLIRGFSKSCGCIGKEISKRAPFNAVLSGYRVSAKDRGLTFNLSDGVFEKIIHEPCYYCGSLDTNCHTSHIGKVLKYNGIDRVDNTLGYEEGNVVPCCYICNHAKGTKTLEEFMGWIESLIKFNGGAYEKVSE